MPTVSTVTQALTLDVGDTLEAIQGVIKGIWKQTTGSGQRGEWKRQFILLGEGNNSIGVTLWGQTEIEEGDKGSHVYISGRANKKVKGAFVGITVEQDSKDDSKTALKVSEEASVEMREEDAAPAPPPKKQGSSAPAQRPAPAPAAARPGDEKAAKKSLARMANCYTACYVAALYAQRAISAKTNGGAFSQEQFQACVSSLFIEACKNHLWGQFAPVDFSGAPPWENQAPSAPTAPAPEPPPPAPEPEPAPEDDVPF